MLPRRYEKYTSSDMVKHGYDYDDRKKGNYPKPGVYSTDFLVDYHDSKCTPGTQTPRDTVCVTISNDDVQAELVGDSNITKCTTTYSQFGDDGIYCELPPDTYQYTRCASSNLTCDIEGASPASGALSGVATID